MYGLDHAAGALGAVSPTYVIVEICFFCSMSSTFTGKVCRERGPSPGLNLFKVTQVGNARCTPTTTGEQVTLTLWVREGELLKHAPKLMPVCGMAKNISTGNIAASLCRSG